MTGGTGGDQTISTTSLCVIVCVYVCVIYTHIHTQMVDRGPCRPACLSGDGVLLLLSALSHTWLARQTHTRRHTRICSPFYMAHMGLSTKTSHLLFQSHIHRLTHTGLNKNQRAVELSVLIMDNRVCVCVSLLYVTLSLRNKFSYMLSSDCGLILIYAVD